MGYSITIGELNPLAISHNERDEDNEDLDEGPRVNTVRLDHAPATGDPTDFTNERWPSYSGWADFLEATELTFLSPRTSGYAVNPLVPPLMEDHPGVMPVLPVHLVAIDAAMAAYRQRIGLDKKPGWGTTTVLDPSGGPAAEVQEADHHLYDGQYGRLVWLQFWVKWALENCKNPVCWNT